LGVGCLVHVVPFHLSASDTQPAALPVKERPIAVHAVGDEHDTP
jgi:hypothetical protein